MEDFTLLYTDKNQLKIGFYFNTKYKKKKKTIYNHTNHVVNTKSEKVERKSVFVIIFIRVETYICLNDNH
jgi:hypothetical protein